MDTKYKDDLFRKYVQFHECKLNASDNKQRPINDEYLRVAAAALLCLPKIDPFYRFRLIKFYEMAENSLRSVKSSSLHSLHNAFSMLETVGINLFLYPWKKEFKNIKVRHFMCGCGDNMIGFSFNTSCACPLKAFFFPSPICMMYVFVYIQLVNRSHRKVSVSNK